MLGIHREESRLQFAYALFVLTGSWGRSIVFGGGGACLSLSRVRKGPLALCTVSLGTDTKANMDLKDLGLAF